MHPPPWNIPTDQVICSDHLKQEKFSETPRASGWYPVALFKAPLWLVKCLAQNEVFQSYISIRSRSFFSIHCWTTDCRGNQLVPREMQAEGQVSSNGRFFLLLLSELQLTNPLAEANPKMKGKRRKAGGSGVRERKQEKAVDGSGVRPGFESQNQDLPRAKSWECYLMSFSLTSSLESRG